MPWIAAAAVLGSGVISAVGSNAAANTQAGAANDAAGVQQNMFNTTQQNLAPWISGGANSLDTLQSLLGIPHSSSPSGAAPNTGGLPAGYSLQPIGGNGGAGAGYDGRGAGAFGAPQSATGYSIIGPGGQVVGSVPTTGNPMQAATTLLQGQGIGTTPTATPMTAPGNALTDPRTLMGTSFQSSPGYQYDLNQTMQGVTNSAAARGGITGGNTLMALQQNASGLANQNYYNWLGTFLNQANNYVGQVSGVSSLGENAAANLGNTGVAAANNIGNYMTQAGNANAAGTMGITNALTNGIQNIDWSALNSGNSGGLYNNAWGA